MRPEECHFSKQSVPLVFADGSSAVEEGIGRLVGYGIFCHDCVSIVASVRCDRRQTNNSAELLAALRALQLFTLEETTEVAICTDSQFVILSTSGAARR